MSNVKGLPRQEYLVCLFLVVMILAGYWQIPTHNFVYFDDYKYISENLHLQEGITVKSVGWAFSTSYFSYWHPLTWLSHMLDYQLFGMRPGMHHLVNLFLHILNTFGLFLVFKRITGAFWRSAFVAGLFALHPLNSEAVPMGARIANAIVSYGRYIGKAIMPRNLAVFYPFSETLTMWQVIGTGLLLMGGTTLIIFAGRQRPYLTVGWLWFIGTLVPVIGIVQWGLWPAMADRFAYVPLIGLFVLFSWGLSDIFTVLDKGRVLFVLSVVIILSTLTICTFL